MRRSQLTRNITIGLLTARLGFAQPSAPEPGGASSQQTAAATTAAPSASPSTGTTSTPDSAVETIPSTTTSPSAALSPDVGLLPHATPTASETPPGVSPPVTPATAVTADNVEPDSKPVAKSPPGRVSVGQNPGSPKTEPSTSEEPTSSALEDPEPSQGHFIAIGVHGVGALAFDKHRGTREPTFGPGFSLRFGEAVTDWLDLSLSFALATTSGDADDSVTFGRFGLQSQWYVSERLFISAGFGATNAQGKDPEDHELQRGRYGDVYLTGVGYNLYLSDNNQSGGWVLTPVLTAEVGPDRTFTTTALWLGVEISWWTGLSRDKLNLPLSKAYEKSPD